MSSPAVEAPEWPHYKDWCKYCKGYVPFTATRESLSRVGVGLCDVHGDVDKR